MRYKEWGLVSRASLKLVESIYQEAMKQLYSEFTNSQKQQVFNFLKKIETHLNHALLKYKTELIEFVKGLIIEYENNKSENG